MIKIDTEKVTTPHGVVTCYTLTNGKGAFVELQSLGAGVRSIVVPDSLGNLADVVLGYADVADYMADGPCLGKTPGRYANRIGLGKFSIDGVDYQLNINNGPNALHGGPTCFANHIWESEAVGDKVVFTLHSVDGDENYPGNLDVKVEYSWSEDSVLTINYNAVTDMPTVVNLTNHTYFNLAGESAGSGMMKNHKLKLCASKYLPTNDSLVPTGEFAPVSGTPMDFTVAKRIGENLHDDFPAINYGKGYDSSWVIDGYTGTGVMTKAAVLTEENSGRVLTVETTQPAVQVYTGNWLAGSPVGKCGHSYNDYDGVALECQGMPDAPNKPNFPSQVLRPGEVYNHTIRFIFTTL